ncbi:MAG: tetratricopeptide repeat protein, partial [Betaproteobacteria bacterium]|nr:tetratricopeptide repeat protein [Betaproteobacteria bacterium]
HPDALHLLGMLAHQAGQSEIAIELINHAIQASPANHLFHNNLGTVFQAIHHHDQAVTCFKQAISFKPDYIEARNNLGNTLADQGKLDEAIVCFQKAIALKPDYIEAHNNLGATFKSMGDLNKAIACYKQVIAFKPEFAEAHYNLGIAFNGQGKLDEAAACYQTATTLKPDFVEAYNNLGVTLKDQGKLNDAIECFQQLLMLRPEHVEALNNLGVALKNQKKLDEAATCFKKALLLRPNFVESLNNLGNTLREQDKLDEAVACYQQALALNPNFVDAYSNLGTALSDQGRHDEAIACCQQALAINPNNAEAHSNLSSAFKNAGRLDEAIASSQQALALRPDYAEAYNNLGSAFEDYGNLDKAIACYRQALEINPFFAEAHNNLGNALSKIGRFDEAIKHCQQALELKPHLAACHNNLALILSAQGQIDEAVASFRTALKIKPAYNNAHSALIFALDLASGTDFHILQQERKNWGSIHADPLTTKHRPHANVPDPERRLRIGYVSADFRRHSAATAFGAMLVKFDRKHFDVVAYSNTTDEDQLTHLFRQNVTQWRKIAGLPDDAVAKLIRGDEIDILVDLSGHTAGNRLLAFARKPAPIQVSAWGYPTGTGMQAMDVLFSDPVVIPPEEKPFYTEQVCYLPNVVSFFSPETFPAVRSLPALATGTITFGSFNRLAKVSRESFELWTRVLAAVPGSRLMLKSAEFGDTGIRERISRQFAEAGIAPERLVMLGKTTWREHVGAFNQVDIALDPFPQGGGVTTLECLMMGVPIVTLRWPTFAGRLSASILRTLDLTDWVAETPEQYLEIAIENALNLESLATLHQSLRSRFTASSIGDADTYVKAVETEYRQLWQEWCDSIKAS